MSQTRSLAPFAFLALCSLGFALVPSCTLMGLGEYEIGECTDNAECQAMNEGAKLDAEDCEAYQCRADRAGCELRPRDFDNDGVLVPACSNAVEGDCDDADAKRFPGNSEECDGVDNDCNGVIDDGLSPGDASLALTFAEEPTHVVFGTAANDPWVTLSGGAVNGAGTASFEHIDPGADPRATLKLKYRSETKQDTLSEERENKALCPRQGAVDLVACDFGESAGTPAGNDFIVAVVDTEGCREGLLRIGHLEGDTELLLRGPEQHSNIWQGIDPDPRCTGLSRSSGVLGAARPALAGRDTAEYPQALVSFVADSVEREACAREERDVEVLGVFLEHIDNRTQVRWTSGTNNGLPQVLGRTAGGGRPVVLATTASEAPGYVVGYAAAGGGLALHFLDEFPFAPNTKYEFSSPIPSTAIRSTQPLNLGTETVLFSDRELDHVAITQVVASDHLRLGISWIEGACTSERSVHFAEVRWFWEGSGKFEADEPVEVAAGLGASNEAPGVVYQPEGFVISGYERDGETASDENTGGFVIAWADEASLQAKRLLDLDGQLLEESELGLYQAGSAAEPLSAQLFGSGNQTYFAAFEHDSSELYVGELLCKKQ